MKTQSSVSIFEENERKNRIIQHHERFPSIKQVIVERSFKTHQTESETRTKLSGTSKKFQHEKNRCPQERQEIFRHLQHISQVSTELSRDPNLKTQSLNLFLQKAKEKTLPQHNNKKYRCEN
jgi:hypothetical protein